MKARPIGNVLKHCKKMRHKNKYRHPSDWLETFRCEGWVEAIEYVIDNYNCTPREQGQPCMAVKRLSGGQYYVEMEIADNVTSRFVFDNKEDYDGFIKSMKEEGNKITAQGEYQALPFL